MPVPIRPGCFEKVQGTSEVSHIKVFEYTWRVYKILFVASITGKIIFLYGSKEGGEPAHPAIKLLLIEPRPQPGSNTSLYYVKLFISGLVTMLTWKWAVTSSQDCDLINNDLPSSHQTGRHPFNIPVQTRSTAPEKPSTTRPEQPSSTEIISFTTEKQTPTPSTTSQNTQPHPSTDAPIDLHSSGPTTTVSSPMTTTPNLDNRPLSFFQKKGAVAGVFSALGCVLIALFLIIILLLRRRHRTKRLQDGDEDMKNLNVRENSLSTVGEAPLTSVAPLAPMFPQGTMSTMWDSDPGSHLMHHIPPPPAYTESSRRPTVGTAHELAILLITLVE
ncbi:hypothetical protein BDZ94DRAFT_1239863 [Collybia nuda]|uniref:Uncharacterized protein n=1 Tax=Collybia nuda TaxID=64659 RepID=A0A9P5XXP0_9AGAR|nr:hypothetical protein BDZ94DRAFT_1239863 [Collybia nuda]